MSWKEHTPPCNDVVCWLVAADESFMDGHQNSCTMTSISLGLVPDPVRKSKCRLADEEKLQFHTFSRQL